MRAPRYIGGEAHVEVGPPSNKLQPLLNEPRTYDIMDFERNFPILISSDMLQPLYQKTTSTL